MLHGGGGLPNLLLYYMGGLFKVYYNIIDLVHRNMEGHKSYLVLDMFCCGTRGMHFVSNFENCRKYAYLGEYG